MQKGRDEGNGENESRSGDQEAGNRGRGETERQMGMNSELIALRVSPDLKRKKKKKAAISHITRTATITRVEQLLICPAGRNKEKQKNENLQRSDLGEGLFPGRKRHQKQTAVDERRMFPFRRKYRRQLDGKKANQTAASK